MKLKEKLRAFIPVIKEYDNLIFKGFFRRIYNNYLSKQKKNKSFFHGKKVAVLREAVADLILMQISQEENKFNQYQAYDFAVRYLAIENYYNINNVGFELYKKMHTLAGNYGQINDVEKFYKLARSRNQVPIYGGGKEQHSIEQFTKLINSIDEKGYIEESYVMSDRNLLSMNGSHRITMAFFNNLDYINVEVHNRIFKRNYALDFFWEKGFTRDDIKLIKNTMESIFLKCREKIGCFYCILFPPAEKYFDDITLDISSIDKDLISVISYKDYEKEVADFIGFLNGIYFFDSIHPVNLKRKISYILNASEIRNKKVRFRIITIDIGNPMYRLKADNGMPESTVTVRLKNMIRGRYRVKEKRFTERYKRGYAHDVIIHSTDNFISNNAFRDLLSVNRDLTKVMEVINQFDYAIAGVSEDKVSNDFPQNYFFGEDFDIFIEEKNLQQITQLTYEVCKRLFCDDKVQVSIEDSLFGKRVYITYNGFVLTMFDFMSQFSGIKQEYIHKFVRAKVLVNKNEQRVCVLSLEHELIYRTNKFLKNTSKDYHRDFLVNNKDSIDINSMLKAFDDKTSKRARKLWHKIKN